MKLQKKSKNQIKESVEVVIPYGWVKWGLAIEDIKRGDSLDIEPSTGQVRRAMITEEQS